VALYHPQAVKKKVKDVTKEWNNRRNKLFSSPAPYASPRRSKLLMKHCRAFAKFLLINYTPCHHPVPYFLTSPVIFTAHIPLANKSATGRPAEC
jgi:hypothetical protein